MRFLFTFLIFIAIQSEFLNSKEVIVKKDCGSTKGTNYNSSRIAWEESVVLQPDGPCKVNKIQIYYSGSQIAWDTLWVVGFPTAGNLYPTEYIWDYNTLIAPVVFKYDGKPGWKDIDVSATGLRSDGFDKIVIQHKFKAIGPHFTYDNDGMQGLSWMTDPFTPNGNFYNIMGTIHYMSSGDYMVRLAVEYDFPLNETSMKPPAPKMVNTGLISGGGYPSVVDWNNDGWDDIVLGGTIFENQKGQFKNISSTSPINASGTTWGDYDNDGKIDCYAIANGAPDYDKKLEWNNNKMYKNTGTKLEAVNQKSVFKTPYPSTKTNFETSIDYNKDSLHNPYNSISPVFMDYNNDGFLDLFIANRRTEVSGKPEIFSPDEFWENDGKGMFANKSELSGIRAGEPYTPNTGSTFGYYDCYGAQAVDFNKDNFTDIFVANYRLIKDNLYMNNGTGNFSEVANEAGVLGLPTAAPDYFGHGMGCQWGDFNNDGNPDLIVGNLAHTDYRGIFSNPSLIFQNTGKPEYTFKAVHKKMGLKFHEGNAGSVWCDLDLDGNLDLWHGKYSGGMGSFYFNQGAPDYKLIEKTWELNCVVQNPWTAVKTDFDNDGDWDMVINGALYRNDIVHKGKYIGIRLTGSPKDKINMDAYGTKVTIYSGGKMFFQELAGSAAGSLCTQNSNELLFGLGDINKIDSTVIEYLNGKKNVLKNLEVNAKYTIAYDGSSKQNLTSTPALVYPENNQVNLADKFGFRWNKIAGVKKYQIEYKGKTKEQSGILYLADTISNDIVLSLGNTYTWKVRAQFNDDSWSEFSSEWIFTTGQPQADTVNLVSPANKSINNLAKTKFIWNKPNFGVYVEDKSLAYTFNLYEEYPKVMVYSQGFITDTTISMLSPLDPNKKYYWTVCASLDGGTKVCSGVWEFTTLGVPSAVTLTEPADQSIDVTNKPFYKWNANETATSYHIQVSLISDFTQVDFEKLDITSPNYKQFKSQEIQKKYYWRVRGKNDGGFGEWSKIWSYTTGGTIDVKEEIIENKSFSIDEISPNPAKDNISFKINSVISDKITILVLNNIGIPIKTFEKSITDGMNKFEISLDEQSSGIYYIKVTNNNLSATKPFLLIH